MKRLIKILFFFFILFFSCGSSSFVMKEVKVSSILITEELIEEPKKVIIEEEEKEKEIIRFWELALLKEEVRIEDIRYKELKRYASDLVEAIKYYQEIGTEGGYFLPEEENIYSLFSSIIFLESRLKKDARGKKKDEVGLMQVHGLALNGHSRKEVIENPRLGIFLGVRWVAVLIGECEDTRQKVINKNWVFEDWAYPLSIYIYGPKGKCQKYSKAKRRLNLAKRMTDETNRKNI